MEELKEIQTRNELADYIKVPRQKLSYILYVKGTENLYKSFEIPKKSGGVRHIHAPEEELKQIQSKLAKVLYEYALKIEKNNGKKWNIAHAFVKGKGCFTNAKIHRNKRILVNVDLKDFFDSFHFGRVRGYFMKNRNYQLSEEVATVIAQIACYKGKLPQGAPTSPVITNLICGIFDIRILHLAKKYRLDYTRYADDLTFSTNDKKFQIYQEQFLEELTNEISKAGFSINQNKTRVQYRDSHQEVTGIVVNKKLNVIRKYYKDTRAMAYNLYKTGEYTIDGEKKGSIQQLEGRFSYINQFDKYNNKLGLEKHQFEYLNGRERAYSQFLFYKYFFANDKPLIITEGKTDIIYLKVALKKMWKEYPEFIAKNEKGQFEYKISFLKRSKRIEYFLNIKTDGADTLNNIMEFYGGSGNPKYSKYIKYLKKISDRKPSNIVVLMFDNELENKESPISKFSRRWLKGKQDELKKENWLYMQDNLYVATTPLVPEYDQTDIEMLFDEEIQNIEIDGRTLDKSGKKDKEKYFNKEIFSKYIMKNYDNIDFENFKPIFENLKEMIISYKEK